MSPYKSDFPYSNSSIFNPLYPTSLANFLKLISLIKLIINGLKYSKYGELSYSSGLHNLPFSLNGRYYLSTGSNDKISV